MLVQVVDVEKRTEIPTLAIGDAVQIAKGRIKQHTEASKRWTPSRSPYYVVVDKDADIRLFNTPPSQWLPHYPETAVEDLQHLAPDMLVCVAGRVMMPEPAKRDVYSV